jgi:hypothetical protein
VLLRRSITLVLALAFLAPVLAHSHLLNMTEATLRVERNGLVDLSLDVDLSRSMATAEDYFALASSLEQSQGLPLWQRIGEAMKVENGGQRVPLTFMGAKRVKNYTLEDFLDPLVWPKVRLRYASQQRLALHDFALDVTFTSTFFFEEPIALAMKSERHQRRINRWLVTDQKSPVLSGENKVMATEEPVTMASVFPMIRNGFQHVLPSGVDHLLFLVGLSWLIVGIKRLIAVVSIFTIAHCVSLLAASFRLVEIDSLLIELGILGTIAWLGLRLLKAQRLSETGEAQDLTRNAPGYGTIFSFGLVHGLGFSNAFLALDITENMVIQLIAFNAGVDFAQIVFITLLATLFFWLRGHSNRLSLVPMVIGWLLILAPLTWAGMLLTYLV